MKDVIVIGKNYATALGVIRSLGEAGYGVKLIGMNQGTVQIAGKSKYVSQYAVAEIDFESLFGAMERLRGNAESVLVIPTNDGICKLLDEHASQLSQSYLIPNIHNKENALSEFMDKMAQKKLAIQCGIRVANGNCFHTNEPMPDSAMKEIGFPCFVKPVASANVIGCKTLFAKCDTHEELAEAINYAARRNCEKVLVEQYLNIDEELCVYGVAGNGVVYAPACVAAIRGGFAEHKGVTAEGKVFPASRLGVIQNQIEDFIRRSGLIGMFCTDIIRCGQELYYVETNLRFGGSGYAITLAGANLPAALADMVYGHSVNRPMTVAREIAFLNERIEFDAYCGGFYSKKEYEFHMSGGQERFIRSAVDKEPWIAFQRITRRQIVKKKIKNLLGEQANNKLLRAVRKALFRRV